MFERFTDRARHSIQAAQEQARSMGHATIEVEHVMLGLFAEPQGIAGRTLASLGITVEQVHEAALGRLGQGAPEALPKHVPFTPAAKKVLELSLREALQLGHNYIGTEHILLGLVRVGGVDPDVESFLQGLGIASAADVRKIVVRLLSEYTTEVLEEAVGEATAVTRARRSKRRGKPDAAAGPACPNCSAELSATARYTTWEVPELNGKGSAPVLFLFCSGCGHTIDDVILPSE